MQNIKEFMDTVGQIISEQKTVDGFFSTMDPTYAYGQLPLIPKTSVQCNLLLVGGNSTGAHRFKTGFFGVTTMPPEFQRVMDAILSEFPQARGFIDDILVVTKGSEIEHISAVEKNLRKIDKENMSLKLTKTKYGKRTGERVATEDGRQWG